MVNLSGRGDKDIPTVAALERSRSDVAMSRLTQSLPISDKRSPNPLRAGDPSPEARSFAASLVDAGAIFLSWGAISDLMSEGPVIQKGHERALGNGMSLQRVLMVAEFRKDNDRTPIVMMGCQPQNALGMRPRRGQCRGRRRWSITVDLPPEEAMRSTAH